MSSANASLVLEPILPKPLPATRGGSPWTWTLIACLLLGVSGVVRAMQASRHQAEKSYKETCPIDLAKLPGNFGREWKLVKGGEKHLDDLTMRITGGTDHLIRTYANDLTGVSVTVLVLFGPAEPVLPHTPEVCYPATGFTPGDFPSLRAIEYPTGEQDAKGQPIMGRADFLAASYSKPNGRQSLREAVYHSFRLDGQWSPYIGQGRKFPRRNPGIFKVQIHRLVAERESVGEGDLIEPMEQFLKILVAEIEAEIRAANAKDDAAKAVASK